MVRHAAEVGWLPLPPDVALQKRGGDAGMLFRNELMTKLREFNSWMDEDAVRSVVEKIEALPPTIEGNCELLCWLRGERQGYDETEQRNRHIRLIDFDTPGNNALCVTWEWRLKPLVRKGNRADVIFLVNGVPVALVEHKNPKDRNAIERGITQLQRYEQETPELMGAPQLFNVTHLLEYWYGVTWNVSRRFMARWKERPEDSYRFAVQSFFEPTDFLRTLRDWILFYIEDGEMKKSVLRQHQRRAIDAIVERCAEPEKRRGLIWHTQGSGKTFTFLTAARLILEKKEEFHNPTVIVVVDRTELEGHLVGWVERLLGEMKQQEIAVWRAGSRAELQELLKTDKRGLVLSMIHKFDKLEKDANTRSNVYVFIDEAHRSVAKDLGTYLLAALPNATIIGFTGTPVDKTAYGKGTFKIFGTDDEPGYLDKYSIAESIEDETTLPIRYKPAPGELTVPAPQLDREFFSLAKAEGVTDVDELNKVLDRAVGLRTFLTANDRVEKVAAFVAGHYRENVEPLGYKAFLVGVNREACARYKEALDKLLPPEWTVPVYTRNVDDKIKRPLVAELQLSEEEEEDIRLIFKKPDEEPKILIVTDKLLTGFDAPVLYCMYLDKPMCDHVLLQALARVNRPYMDKQGKTKRIGLVIDFIGVLNELNKALQFDSTDVSGVIEDLDLLRKDFLEKIDRAKRNYLSEWGNGDADEALEEIVYGRFLELEARKEFYDKFKEIEALWEILSPAPELYDQIPAYKRLVNLYTAVRNAYASQVNYEADLADKTREMVQDSAVQETLGYLEKTVTFDVKTLQALRDEAGSSAEAKAFNLVRGLRQEIKNRPHVEPVLSPLKERAEKILKDLEERKTTGVAALEQLSGLAGEKEAAMEAALNSGLSPRAFSVHWQLKGDEAIIAAGIPTLDLAREVETLMNRFPNAGANPDEKRRLRAALYRPLLQLGKDERSEIVKRILAILLDTDSSEDI